MKKSVLALVIAGVFAAMPVAAAEQKQADMNLKEALQRCALQSETIDQKIDRLKSEIDQGKKTYSAEELRKLEEKLNEANYLLDSITRP